MMSINNYYLGHSNFKFENLFELWHQHLATKQSGAVDVENVTATVNKAGELDVSYKYKYNANICIIIFPSIGRTNKTSYLHIIYYII